MNIRLSERNLKTKFGVFREVLYYNGQKESIALVMGEVAGKEDILCRIHSRCISAHEFSSIECDCREQMQISQFLIEENGSGIIIWLDQEGKGNGHLALIESTKYKEQGIKQADAYVRAGYAEDARDYKAAAQILTDLGIKSIILLAKGPDKAEALEKILINIAGIKDLELNDEQTLRFNDKILNQRK